MTDPMTMTPTQHLRDALATLHAARQHAAAADAQVAEEKRAWEGAHADLLAQQVARRETLQLAEQMVRELTVAHFEATGERKPCAGVEIAMQTTVAIRTEEALAWAKSTGLCLIPESVDEKALTKVAKATPLPFVTLGEKPMVRIASDLGKALATVEAPAVAGDVA